MNMQLKEIGNTLKDHQSRREARWPINIDLDFRGDQIAVAYKRFPITYGAGDVRDLNERFVEILDSIRKKLLQQQGSNLQLFSNANHHLEQLRDVGIQACALLPKGMFEYIATLEQQESDRGLSLDFTFSAGMALWWEMIYTGAPVGPVDINKFWGLRYPIGRLFRESEFVPRIRLQKGAFALAHNGLSCSKEELTKLEQQLSHMGEHCKREVILHRLEDAISQVDLSADNVLAHFNDAEFIYGLVHFACHCVNPGSAGASRAYISLATPQKEVNLSLGKFNVLASHDRGFRKRPLVFLNACESATSLHLLQSLNLPTALLNFGAGGVIATACTLPDNFASAFATEFYERLLGKPLVNAPAYIGEALLETRLHFLKKYNNPLGLAYGLYALSNQSLQLE